MISMDSSPDIIKDASDALKPIEDRGISFYERSIDNLYEVSVDESNLVAEDTDAATAIKDWFSKVQGTPDAAA